MGNFDRLMPGKSDSLEDSAEGHHTKNVRNRLTEDAVFCIFRRKGGPSSASSIAKIYSVSEKCVRDIWKGRTWLRQTCHLDVSRILDVKTLGRSLDRRDSQPRKAQVHLTKNTSAQMPVSYTESTGFGNNSDPVHSSKQTRSFEECRPVTACQVKSLDLQLYKWEKECEVSLDFQDPFHEDLASLLSLLGKSTYTILL